jgi:hypothetical protein
LVPIGSNSARKDLSQASYKTCGARLFPVTLWLPVAALEFLHTTAKARGSLRREFHAELEFDPCQFFLITLMAR